jgi:protein O-GlcNAc transferase
VIVWRTSLSLWSHAARVAPSSPVAFCNLGQAHLEAGAVQEASLALSVAARLKPDYADVYNNMGVVSILRGDVRGGRRLLERARSLLEEAPSPGPELADVYRNLGQVHSELGELDSALASYRRCLTAQPQDALAWYGMSHVLDAMGHPEEALRARERAARLGNRDAQREVEDALRSVRGGGEKSENPP